MSVTVDFCGERHVVPVAGAVTIGREGDLAVDDNPYLHRHFLRVISDGALCWLVNVGTQIAATVSDPDGMVQAWLAPGARLPIVFRITVVRFTAGPTTYELSIESDEPAFASALSGFEAAPSGDTT